MSLLSFRDVVAERAVCLEPLGFTERQSRFLTTVMAHSGVFLERQYCRFAGIAHGQKSHDFIDRLVQRGFARVETTRHLYQGRFYHLHHKRLYSLIGQTDNRNRKRAHRSRMIERLMLLDIVLDDRDVLWLGTESDKARYFHERLAEYRLTPRELPHLTFGSGPNQVLRLFADKLPIGVDPLSDRYVFTYLVTRLSPQEFRSFLMRHFTLMRSLLRWTLRVFVPKKFEKAIPALEHAVNEEFRRPLRPRDGEELLWFFRRRREATGQPAFVPDRRYLEAAKQFSAPRFAVREKAWRLHGDDVIWNTYSKGIEDQFESAVRRSSSRSSRGSTCTSPTWSASPEARGAPRSSFHFLPLETAHLLCSRCWSQSRNEAVVFFPGHPLKSRSKGGQVPEMNLSPSTWPALHVGAPPVFSDLSSTFSGKDTTRQRVVRVDVAESGRRRMPSAGKRALVADGKRGVNDPGVAWLVRPRARVRGGRSRPAVSMSGEARAASFVRRIRRSRQAPALSRGMSPRGRHDGHHVREHARSARRRARFSAALRPRASHAARACPSWVLDDCRLR